MVYWVLQHPAQVVRQIPVRTLDRTWSTRTRSGLKVSFFVVAAAGTLALASSFLESNMASFSFGAGLPARLASR
jgi:hypothetical protein